MNHYDCYVCDGCESTRFSAGGVLGITQFTIVRVYSQTAAVALMVREILAYLHGSGSLVFIA